MVRPKEVKALEGYRLWLRYSDGVEGEVDLSHLAGHGLFKAWQERAFFEAVRIDEAGAIVWGFDDHLPSHSHEEPGATGQDCPSRVAACKPRQNA